MRREWNGLRTPRSRSRVCPPHPHRRTCKGGGGRRRSGFHSLTSLRVPASLRTFITASGPAWLGADVAEEFDDRMRGEVRRDARSDVKQRIDLDEIEADDIRMFGDRDEDLPKLVVHEATGLRGDAPGHERHVEDVDVDAHVDRSVGGEVAEDP